MKVLRYYQPGKVEVEEAALAVIGAGEVLVKVRACGVCATDIKTYLRGHPKFKPGSVLGHEVSGVIVETNQAAGWRAGMRVAVAPYSPCYTCDQCARGNFTQCEHLMDEAVDPGGFSEYARLGVTGEIRPGRAAREPITAGCRSGRTPGLLFSRP